MTREDLRMMRTAGSSGEAWGNRVDLKEKHVGRRLQEGELTGAPRQTACFAFFLRAWQTQEMFAPGM